MLVKGAWSVQISALIQTRQEETILWIECLYFSRKQRFKVKRLDDGLGSSQDVN